MTRFFLLMLMAASMQAPPGIRYDPTRAARNYEAVATGRLEIGNLSQHDRAEIAELDRQLRKRRATLTPSAERCRAREHARMGSPPSALDERVIALRCN